jgi:ABC-2 type transport system permease protein
MHYLRLIGEFFKVSTQAEMAYRANFFIRILNALLNLVTGVLSLTVIFNQVESIKGWDLPSAMALLGVYLLLTALRGLFISPSLESVAGMDGEIWQGTFDFTLLRPVDKQFLVSFRHWRVLMLFDLALALGVLGYAIYLLEASLNFLTIIQFILTLAAGVTLLYSALLAFSAMVFWNSGFLFTWVINDLFQLARYPVGLYPGWLRLILTWIIPVGLMTTIPAQALSGTLSWGWLLITLVFTLVVLLGASWLFRQGLKKYTSASS